MRRLFIVGVFASAPIGLTIWLLVWLFGWFDSLFQPLVMRILPPSLAHPFPGQGLVLGILFILLVGLFAPSLMGKQILFSIERIIERVPLVKLVYSGSKQIFDSFSSTNLQKFNRVVLIRFPHEKSYAIGFVTQDFDAKTFPNTESPVVGVFVPTTPNPTSGYLVFVTLEETQAIDLSVEDALKLVISGGLVKAPGLLNVKNPSV